MEHSALHAFELMGQILALGGVFLVLGLIRPAIRFLRKRGELNSFSNANGDAFLEQSAARWTFYGIVIASAATFLTFFVDVAEIQGQTVFGGIDPERLLRFATGTIVGRLKLAHLCVLLLTIFTMRLRRGIKWWLTGAGVFASMFLNGMVSHSAAQPDGRWFNILIQMAHITAAAVWMGVLGQLLAARAVIQGQSGLANLPVLAEVVKRFSPVALAVTSLLMFSGILLLFRLAGAKYALLISPYGLILALKMALLAPALAAGWTNFRFIRPRLNECARRENGMAISAQEKTALLRRFGRWLELEVTAGALVIMVAGILASVSPPGNEEGAYRLTSTQARALMLPRIPGVQFANPATFYGLAERTKADLQYAEFTHHWSGVMVTLLGLFWLVQTVGGRAGKWAARGWPLLLLPFLGFVAVASDPEIWLLRRIGFRDVLSDPQLLEHQLGAVLILALAWLGWRDQRKNQTEPPLGYLLPVIFIFGGMLLLGHAHSNLTSTNEIVNLITLEHVVFGMFIIFAGVTRWLCLRGLCPRRLANTLWPAFICGLGLFMTFFYREIV